MSNEAPSYCSECGKPQFSTPSGVTCENGHGGAPGTPTQYPELERMRAVGEESRSIGSFLDWLCEQGITLCEVSESRYRDGEYLPISEGPEALLARYYDIDLEKIETERRRMLDELREKQ